MRVISKARLRDFWSVHRAAQGVLETWHSVVSDATWHCFADVRNTYNSADTTAGLVVFNVNSNRIIADVAFATGCVYIKHVFTHNEYDTWNRKRR